MSEDNVQVLRCSNSDCEGRSEGLFNVTVTVGQDRDVAENMQKIPARAFECAYCFARAEEAVS